MQSSMPYTLSCVCPLHLVKRCRYRFLKYFLSLCLKLNDANINCAYVKAILGYANERIFADDSTTKMNDEVALKMFSFESLDILKNQPKNQTNLNTFLYFLICVTLSATYI